MNTSPNDSYRKIREHIMLTCNLYFDGKWETHKAFEIYKENSSLEPIPPIPPSNSISNIQISNVDKTKGYYDSSKKIISISEELILKEFPFNYLTNPSYLQKDISGIEISEVIIHELLHAFGYNHGEKMDKEVIRKLNMIQGKKLRDILF